MLSRSCQGPSLLSTRKRCASVRTGRQSIYCSSGAAEPAAAATSVPRLSDREANGNKARRDPETTFRRRGGQRQPQQEFNGGVYGPGRGHGHGHDGSGNPRDGAMSAVALEAGPAAAAPMGRLPSSSAPSRGAVAAERTKLGTQSESTRDNEISYSHISYGHGRSGILDDAEPSTSQQQQQLAAKYQKPQELQGRGFQQTKRPVGHGDGRDGRAGVGIGRELLHSSTTLTRRSVAPNRQPGWFGREGSCGRGDGSGVVSPMGGAKQINIAIMDAGARRSWQDVLQLVAQRGQDFNAVNTATALHRLGSCGLQLGSLEARQLLADPRFSQLERLAEEHVASFGPREVANCLWALAKLGYQPVHNNAANTSIRTDPWSQRFTDGDGDDDAVDSDGDDGGGGGGFPVSRLGVRRRAAGVGAGTVAADAAANGSGGGGGGGPLLAALCSRAEVLAEELGQQEVTNTLWALGTLGHHPGVHLLRNLTRRLLDVLREVAPQGVASSLLGMAKLEWSPGPAVLDKVAHGSLSKIGEFNAQALSNTMWSLARLGHFNDQLQAAVFQQALRCLPQFNPQGVANLLWAAATLGLRVAGRGGSLGGGGGRSGGGGIGSIEEGDVPELLVRRMCDQAALALQNYTPQNVSNLLWAIAKLSYRHEALLRTAASQAARQLAAAAAAEGQGREAAGGSSSSSSSGEGSADAGAHGGGRGGGGLHAWNSQEVANATWAYASLGFRPGHEFLRQVCLHMSSPRRLSGYKWQEVANTMWALATLQHRDTAALEAVEREVVDRLEAARGQGQRQGELQNKRALRPPDVSMLLWAYATLEHPAPELCTALLRALSHRLAQFSDPELNSSLWAVATLGVCDSDVMDVVANHICSHRLPYLHIHHVANIAWSYSELRHAHKALFDGLVARAVSYPPATSITLSGPEGDLLVLWHFARLCCAAGVFGWCYPTLLEATIQRFETVCLSDSSGGGPPRAAVAHAGTATAAAVAISDGAAAIASTAITAEFSAQRLELVVVSLTWGLSLVGGCSPRVWGQLMELLGQVAEAQGLGGVLDLPDAALRQLYQAYMNVRCDYPTADLATVPGGLLHRAAEVWRFRSVWGVQVSSLQQAVSEAMTRMGLNHTIERLVDNGDFSIDLAVELKIPGERALPVAAGRLSPVERQYHHNHRPLSERDPEVATGDSSGNSSNSGSSSSSSSSGSSSPRKRSAKANKVVRVAMEVDGPTHFTSNTRQPLSTTLYRRRCLEARGWVVVSVPYWRWNECVSSPDDQEALLMGLLSDAGLGEVLAATATERAIPAPATGGRRRRRINGAP